MLIKLVLTLLIASLSWASVLCPKHIQTRVKSAIKTELITEGESLRGFRVFIRSSSGGAKIMAPVGRTKAAWITHWGDYLELLYVLQEDTLPKDQFPVKVLADGKTYICTVSIYYTFYGGLVAEVE